MWMPSLPARPVADPAAVKRAGAARTVTSSSSRSASLMSRAPACSIVAAGVTGTVLGTWSTRRSMRVELTVTPSRPPPRPRLPHRGAGRDRDGIGYLVHPPLDARGTDGDLIEPRHAAIGGGGLLGRCHGWGHCPHHAQRQRCFCLARHSASQIRCRHWLAQAGSCRWRWFPWLRRYPLSRWASRGATDSAPGHAPCPTRTGRPRAWSLVVRSTPQRPIAHGPPQQHRELASAEPLEVGLCPWAES